MTSVPVQLRIWRVTYGMRQQDAADAFGCSLATWSRWERGISVPSGADWRELQLLMSGPPSTWVRRLEVVP